MKRYYSIFLAAAVVAAMITGIDRDYLLGSDEPREAEISRETLAEGRWVTPYLCGQPFLEKPPLYYNLAALAFLVSGRVEPFVARAVSVLLGCLMLAAVWFFGRSWRGPRPAGLMVLVLATMPRFWRYSHLILLDIGVGAFAAWALAAFARAEIISPSREKASPYLYLFWFSAVLAFLTKGVAALFSVAVVAAGFCLLERRWRALKSIFAPGPLLFFLLPAAVWLILYYREGGYLYLHEHFVNNLIGRFHQVQFHLPHSRFYHTDVGRPAAWHFYLQRLPDILGVWTVFLPAAAWSAVRVLRRPEENPDPSVFRYLLLWSFLPPLLLSFSAQKEVTYIIASYAGMAILVGAWLERAILSRAENPWSGVVWLGLIFPLALLELLLPPAAAPVYIVASAVILAAALVRFVVYLHRRKRAESLYLGLAILLGLTLAGHSPDLYRLTHRPRKESCWELAPEVWREVGEGSLYLYRPRDDLRGSISFYGRRTVVEINRPEELYEVLSGRGEVFVAMRPQVFAEVAADPGLEESVGPIRVRRIAGPEPLIGLVLVSPDNQGTNL